jgi:hypothetical protein
MGVRRLAAGFWKAWGILGRFCGEVIGKFRANRASFCTFLRSAAFGFEAGWDVNV